MKHWRETAEIVDRVIALASAGRHAALATVIRIEGSSYRRPGAKFLIEDDGRTLGGVSGGCLEADVRDIGLHVIQTGTPQLLHYDTGADDRTVWGLGLGCNGSVDIFVQPATDAAHAGFAAGDSSPSGERVGICDRHDRRGSGGCRPLDRRRARRHVTPGPASIRAGPETVFTEILNPPPDLIVCGAGDDSRPLVAYASEAGFRRHGRRSSGGLSRRRRVSLGESRLSPAAGRRCRGARRSTLARWS